ncbi:SDR family oxidoreductase [Paucibacter sp. XJ19-41]|uniref:SDR family oxidoreductase n=1 Tax=Paucibacter sp. XJ19-41 TaxID=2927824 RepID=UPI0023499136|nr:SDR family oxidoreductase [Paucibacter sp. XJ19-41]MDC6167021.1 SDR family oxidoreductase [Paucibacter sp. XJ19-41]
MKLVYITGASSGIGQALALQYYRAGWRLALVARRVDELRIWAQAQDLAPERWAVYGADVRDVAAITGAGRACIATQGLPDVVIANAGISIGMDSAELADIEVMRQIYETNNIGLAATFQPFVAAMLARGSGALVGIGSVAGIRGLPGHAAYCSSKAAVISYCESLRGECRPFGGLPGHAAYCSSKAAVISYCESLRGECRPFGVKVVTISPGYIDTPLTRQNRYSMPFLMQPDDFAARAFEAIAAGASYRVIPWQMGVVAKLMRALPNALFDKLLAGRPRKHRQGH